MNSGHLDSDLTIIIEKLKSIAQNGLTYTDNPYDKERFLELQQITANLISFFKKNKNLSDKQIIDILSKDKGYNTPRLDTRAAIFNNKDQILLIQETHDHLWSLPGGFVDIGESPRESIIREVKEETGFNVEIVKFAALWDKHKHDHPPQLPHIYKIMFICNILNPNNTFKPNHEISDLNWFSEDCLPKLSLHRVTYSQINKLYSIKNNPDINTEID